MEGYRVEGFPFAQEFIAHLLNYYLLDGRLFAGTLFEMALTEDNITLLAERMKNERD